MNSTQWVNSPLNDIFNLTRRKSSDADLSEGRGTPKQSRSPGYGPDQQRSSQSSLNISNSTAMHTSFVDGAKRILHVPGQPCERV